MGANMRRNHSRGQWVKIGIMGAKRENLRGNIVKLNNQNCR